MEIAKERLCAVCMASFLLTVLVMVQPMQVSNAVSEEGIPAFDNCVFSSELYVSSAGNSKVISYNGQTGALIGDFVTAGLGGLSGPFGLVFGPDGNLYVSSAGNNKVISYNGQTGALIGDFVTAGLGGLNVPFGLVFGPDGNLYVSSSGNNKVISYNGQTGALIGDFVTAGLGGLDIPVGLVFGPDGNLYVSSSGNKKVISYNGQTGALIGDFVTAGLGGLSRPEFLVFKTLSPSDPISMNTVRNGNIAKTIHAEKEVFRCTLEQGDIPVIVDLTIIGEMYESMNTQSIISKQALSVTCVKEASVGTIIGCVSSQVEDDTVPVGNCFEKLFSDFNFDTSAKFLGHFFPIKHPQEMNTVNKGSIVKTIEAEKEIFVCDFDNPDQTDDKKVDVVLFTEIWEDLSLLPNNPIIKHTFESMRCLVLISEAEVEACKFSSIND